MVYSSTIRTDIKDEIGKEGNVSPDWIREFQKPMQSMVQLSSSSPSNSLSLDQEKGEVTISSLQSSHVQINECRRGPSDRHGVVLLIDSDEEAPQRIQSSEVKILNSGLNEFSNISSAKRNMHSDPFQTNFATVDKRSPHDGDAKGKKNGDVKGGKDIKDQKSPALKKRNAAAVTGQMKEDNQQRLESKSSLEDKNTAEPKLSLEDRKIAQLSASKLRVPREGNDKDDDISSLPGATKGADEAKLQYNKPSLLEMEPMHEYEIAEEQDRRQKPRITSSLPLVFPDKVHTSKVLVECEDNALDFSGDVGAVGRFSTIKENDSYELLLDLKGIVYKAAIVPSNSFFVVSMGSSEAKVEAVMNDFLQLHPHSNANENETVIEGTLEGLNFGSEDEADWRKVVSESGVVPEHTIAPKTSLKKQSGPATMKKKAGGNSSKTKDKIADNKAKASKKQLHKKSSKASVSRNVKARK